MIKLVTRALYLASSNHTSTRRKYMIVTLLLVRCVYICNRISFLQSRSKSILSPQCHCLLNHLSASICCINVFLAFDLYSQSFCRFSAYAYQVTERLISSSLFVWVVLSLLLLFVLSVCLDFYLAHGELTFSWKCFDNSWDSSFTLSANFLSSFAVFQCFTCSSI